jgi:hypothetical protein
LVVAVLLKIRLPDTVVVPPRLQMPPPVPLVAVFELTVLASTAIVPVMLLMPPRAAVLLLMVLAVTVVAPMWSAIPALACN